MNTAELSEAALVQLQTHGWTQGQAVDGAGRLCLLGAAHAALQCPVSSKGLMKDPAQARAWVVWHQDYAELLSNWGYELSLLAKSPLTTFNDTPGRSYEDVALLLKAHAAGDYAGEYD